MNKDRERKLAARRQRQESLIAFGERVKGPLTYNEPEVDEDRLTRIYKRIGVLPRQEKTDEAAGTNPKKAIELPVSSIKKGTVKEKRS